MKARARAVEMRYIRSGVPKTVPPGFILVHNPVIAVSPRQPVSVNGFRAWLERRRPAHEVCRCGWAPDVARHYRLRSQSHSQ